MTARVFAAGWLILGVALWNAIFDLHVSRGTFEYLHEQHVFQFGGGPEPSMDATMRAAVREGVLVASFWAALVLGGAFATLWWTRRDAPAR